MTTTTSTNVEILHTQPDFPKLKLVHANGKASAEIYLHGATVVSWKILEQDLLFVSDKTVYSTSKGIRGGVPVVFPQFGAGPLPQHGFARVKPWTLKETNVHKQTGDVTAVLTLTDDEETRKLWPYKFLLTITIVLKPTSFSQQLIVENQDEKPFEFTSLLHTYYSVNDIKNTTISGLKDLEYLDKPTNFTRCKQEEEKITFNGEVDRVYENGGSREIVIDDGGNCDLVLKCTGFQDVVVWNPAAERAKSMADLGEDNYPKFVCVEPGSVAKPVTLQPKSTWQAAQGISLRVRNTSSL
jgi:glucose-6-phosphate 1-epimerase